MKKSIEMREAMFRSKEFFVRVRGDYGLFTNPASKGGGEKSSYSIPTRQALNGIVDGLYHKPTFKNIITEVKVMNQIHTEVIGTRALLGNGKADLNYMSYLIDLEYLIRFHFIWNESRPDLIPDRNPKKHEVIMERSLEKGGRRDIFIGTRECFAVAEAISLEEYQAANSYYDGQTLSFGIMFHSFSYPSNENEQLLSYFADTTMHDGVVNFKPQENCEIVNTLSSYYFKYPKAIRSVEDELDDYNKME